MAPVFCSCSWEWKHQTCVALEAGTVAAQSSGALERRWSTSGGHTFRNGRWGVCCPSRCLWWWGGRHTRPPWRFKTSWEAPLAAFRAGHFNAKGLEAVPFSAARVHCKEPLEVFFSVPLQVIVSENDVGLWLRWAFYPLLVMKSDPLTDLLKYRLD